MSRYVLGVDAGGTKTLAVMAADTGRVIGVGVGGAGNRDGAGADAAQRSLCDAITAARVSAGNAEPSAVFAGIAGVVSETDQSIARRMLAPALASPDTAEIDHDCRVALAGGLSGRPGMVLIAGTGASCFGRNAEGKEWRASGWGSIFGDEGSSYWLGVEGVRAVLRAEDGRSTPTALRDPLFTQLGVASADDLLGRAGRGEWHRAELAALAPIVVRTAEAGDEVAQALVGDAADELADAVAAVAAALGFDRTEVAIVGGLLRSDLLRHTLRERLGARLPGVMLIRSELAPVVGAALLALARLHGVEPTALPATVIQALQESGDRLGLRP